MSGYVLKFPKSTFLATRPQHLIGGDLIRRSMLYYEILPFATSLINACESRVKMASYGFESGGTGERGGLGGGG
jgi:hypothetical protein